MFEKIISMVKYDKTTQILLILIVIFYIIWKQYTINKHKNDD